MLADALRVGNESRELADKWAASHVKTFRSIEPWPAANCAPARPSDDGANVVLASCFVTRPMFNKLVAVYLTSLADDTAADDTAADTAADDTAADDTAADVS